MSDPVRQVFRFLIPAVASLLVVGNALGRPVVGADRYIPSVDEVNRTLAPIGYTAEPAGVAAETWDAGSRFHVSGGHAAIYELLLAASVLPTVEEADWFFREEADLLASDNESAQVRTPHPNETPAADDARDLRVIFMGPWTGRRISSYMRLVRVGEVVALVEATGSPEADDHGARDNDRALAVVRLTDFILVKVREVAPTRAPTDRSKLVWHMSALNGGRWHVHDGLVLRPGPDGGRQPHGLVGPSRHELAGQIT